MQVFYYFWPAFNRSFMKKLLSVCAFLCAFLGIAQAQIVVTEIMYNPPEPGTDTLEYIELYSTAAVDISGWNFTQGVTHTFASGTTMAPGAYLVLCENAAYFQSKFGFAPLQWTDGALTNSGEDIELRDAAGNIIDYVDYKNAAPWPVEPNGNGPSLVLCDPNADNALAGAWQAATTPTGVVIAGKEVFANPGAASGCSGTNAVSAQNDAAVVATGASVTVSVLTNDVVPGAIATFAIVTAPQHGSAVTGANNTIVYTANNGYCGADQLSYRVCDGNSCDTAQLNITVACYTPRTIAQVSTEGASGVADSLNVFCELTGTVYGVNLRPLNNNQPALLFTIIDNSGNGIAVSSLSGNKGYTVAEKDIIVVRGKIGQFNGLTEIQPDSIRLISSGNALLAPSIVSSLSEGTESQLVRFNNMRLVDPAEWTTGSGNGGFNVRALSNDFPNDTILIRIDRDVETYNAPVPPEPFTLTGIGGQFDASSPYTSGYQILPRYNNDISTLMTGTRQADYSNLVQVSPNPANDFIQVRTETAFDRLMVFNAAGQKISSIESPQSMVQINTNQWPTGIYVVRLEKRGAFAQKKITVQR
jgi:hypothetical protein